MLFSRGLREVVDDYNRQVSAPLLGPTAALAMPKLHTPDISPGALACRCEKHARKETAPLRKAKSAPGINECRQPDTGHVSVQKMESKGCALCPRHAPTAALPTATVDAKKAERLRRRRERKLRRSRTTAEDEHNATPKRNAKRSRSAASTPPFTRRAAQLFHDARQRTSNLLSKFGRRSSAAVNMTTELSGAVFTGHASELSTDGVLARQVHMSAVRTSENFFSALDEMLD